MGHEHDPIYSLSIYELFSGQVFLEKDCNGKKDRCAVFGWNDDRLFPEKYAVEFSLTTERVPPEYPTILLKSNKFNMASVSVKRSISRDPNFLE